MIKSFKDPRFVYFSTDHVGLGEAGPAGEQGSGQRVEGASVQEYQRGGLQPHPGGPGCGTSPLLPPDPGWRAQTDQVKDL